MNGKVTLNQFKRIEGTDVKLDILFESLVIFQETQLNQCKCRADKCSLRFDELDNKMEANEQTHKEICQKIQKKKWWDRTAAFGGGAVGGFIAMIFERIARILP